MAVVFNLFLHFLFQALLKLDSEETEVPDKVKTAVFYSISAAHKGQLSKINNNYTLKW